MKAESPSRIHFAVLLLIVALALSVATVTAQVGHLGMRFVRVQQEKVHEQMLSGEAGSPWQYRILADLILEPFIRWARDAGLPGPAAVVFIAFRFLQSVLILITAGIFYRRLGLTDTANLLGLSVLTWGMSSALYNSDLSFSVFFDLAFFLLAGILILKRRYFWVALLMVPAALNRETSLLIPVMLASHGYLQRDSKPGARRPLLAAAAGLAVYATIFFSLRIYYGRQEFLTADGYSPGIALMMTNLTRAATWQQLLIAFGIIPLLAALAYRRWPRSLRILFWSVVPCWVAVHFAASLVAETRLMLVPHALVLIPGALFGMASTEKATAERR